MSLVFIIISEKEGWWILSQLSAYQMYSFLVWKESGRNKKGKFHSPIISIWMICFTIVGDKGRL
jgi:hypothetical protein